MITTLNKLNLLNIVNSQVLMKMVALTPQGYFQSRRNRFDMFVTLIGVVWIFLHFTLKAVSD